MNEKIITRRQLIFGWIAVAIVAVIASLRAYRGGIENFYEDGTVKAYEEIFLWR